MCEYSKRCISLDRKKENPVMTVLNHSNINVINLLLVVLKR